jgi:hypothetical protein
MALGNIAMALRLTTLALAINIAFAFHAHAEGFRFESVVSLEAMHDFVKQNIPRPARRAAVRRIFVEEGRATLQVNSRWETVEKYTYNINLCRLYVWRWNISANFNKAGYLTQLFVNGERVYEDGGIQWTAEMAARTGGIRGMTVMSKPRPQADVGESSLRFLALGVDTRGFVTSDEFITGAGPTRADPMNLGTVHAYADLERWRSIFDEEAGEPVHDYAGKCPAVPDRPPAGVIRIRASLAD